jgi:Fe-S cluster biogenesis protein NfuA
MSSEAVRDQQNDEMFKKVEAVIDRIRPAVQADGGDVELVAVRADGMVQVRLHGACVGCPSSGLTLHMGVERLLREEVPGVTGVEAVN